MGPLKLAPLKTNIKDFAVEFFHPAVPTVTGNEKVEIQNGGEPRHSKEISWVLLKMNPFENVIVLELLSIFNGWFPLMNTLFPVTERVIAVLKSKFVWKMPLFVIVGLIELIMK
jgi:hypothetical protein